MRAVRIHEYGGPAVLRYETVPRPEPGPGDVLVRVHAAAVNPVDWKVREGHMREKLGHRLPLTLGWDLSGTIERLGPGVDRFLGGDEVYGRPDISRDGAYAEYAVVRAEELATKPRSISHVLAAAVPLCGLTAWQTLFEAPAGFSSLDLREGQTLLVHGGAGGVGTMAVQLAKSRGARVIATGSARNQEHLRKLGAEVTIDYEKQRFEEVARDVDAVLDTVGGETLARSWAVLRPGGILASTTMAVPAEEARAHQARAAYVFVQPNGVQLGKIARLIDSKAVTPVVEHVFALGDARKAHELIQRGHVRGKLVLELVP